MLKDIREELKELRLLYQELVEKHLPVEEPSEEDTTAPTIVINYPLNDTIFGEDAPTFNLTIYDLSLNISWFTINDNEQNTFSQL